MSASAMWWAYRMAGGAPAGIKNRPGELGCLRNRTRMRRKTVKGKRITTPKGAEMPELPLKRIGRLRKAMRDVGFVLGRKFLAVCLSDVGSGEGCRATDLPARLKRSMPRTGVPVGHGQYTDRLGGSVIDRNLLPQPSVGERCHDDHLRRISGGGQVQKI